MRIAYLLNTLSTGGAERQITALARSMTARGHAVELIVLKRPAAAEPLMREPVIHLGMRRNPASLPLALVRAVRALRAFRPDIIHANNFHGNILARVLRFGVPRARVISTIHNVYEGGTWRSLALQLSDPLSGHSAAVCHAAAEEAIRRRIVPRTKCSVIANGIDCREFAPQAVCLAGEKRAAPATEFVWLAVGRLAPAKDYPNLLRAFAQVHRAAPHARLWIAGEGKPQYSQYLRHLAGTPDRSLVRWLGLRHDIPSLLHRADAFVLSSAWEGMPLALGEAMAMEKPFVATDVGGVRELAGDCGRIVPARDSEALAASMLEWMGEPAELRQAKGRAARRRILAQFTIEESAARWEMLYQRLLPHC